jgi:hypothetical protein
MESICAFSPQMRPNATASRAYFSLEDERSGKAVVLVPFAQFLQQMIKVSRCRERLRPQVSLKPLANSVADRLASSVIDHQLPRVGTGTLHRGAPFAFCFNALPSQKEPIWFPAHLAKDGENTELATLPKNLLKAATRTRSRRSPCGEKAPAVRAGAFRRISGRFA